MANETTGYKNHHIPGDLSVSRNANIGGNTTIHGSQHVKGNVKVDGWLEARNIKGSNKGIFQSESKLRSVYPSPLDGWWAIVGNSLPGDIYVGDGGEWVATGGTGGDPEVDIQAVEDMQHEIVDIEQGISDIKTQLNSLGYTFLGTIKPTDTPIALKGDEKVFYIATEEGDYTNFGLGNISSLSVIKSEDGCWKAEGLGVPFVKSILGKVYELTNTPARSNLAIDSAITLKGYKVNLKNLYDQGFREVSFKGMFYDISSTVVAGVIVDINGDAESYTNYIGSDKPYYCTLMITEKSEYLWATYQTSGDNAWNPEYVFLRHISEIDRYSVWEEKNSAVEDAVNSIKKDIGCNDVILYAGSVSSSGVVQPTTNPNIRVHTDIMDALGDIDISLNEGYLLAYYLYDTDDKFLSSDENFKNTVSLSHDGRIRFMFRKPDNSQIKTSDDIISSLSGVYSPLSKPITSELKDIKNSIKDLQESCDSPEVLETENKILKGVIIEFNDSVVSLESVDSDEYTIIGSNLLDEASLKKGTIKNDQGVEIEDSSQYYTCFIPVSGRLKIASSFPLQRFYYYDAQKQWIKRDFASNRTSDNIIYDIPPVVDGKNVAFVQVQVVYGTPTETRWINYGESLLEYYSYRSNSAKTLYKPISYIYANDLSSISVQVKVLANSDKDRIYNISEFLAPSEVWEPASVDEGYSTPLGRANTKRTNWTAQNKYSYYEFLEHYYEVYVNRKYVNGYRVNKKSIGSDCSKEGYELFEYDFCPQNYTRTVLLSAGMNAIETSGIWGLATFIRCLMNEEEEYMKYLKENVRFRIIPFICPYSFDADLNGMNNLLYENKNGVRINKNFNYRRKWYDSLPTNENSRPLWGEYPDSEEETIILKKWINDYTGVADLYIDCHSDAETLTGYSDVLTAIICSDSNTKNKLAPALSLLKEYYIGEGHANGDTQAQSWVEGGTTYPKTLYAYKECGIPSIMKEQYVSSTAYGSDGLTNNDSYGIKNYVAELRLYIGTLLAADSAKVNIGKQELTDYQLLKNNTI